MVENEIKSKNEINTTNKNLYFFVAAILSIFVPAPGRFAYAITLLVLFNIQVAFVTLFFHFVNFLKLKEFRNILMSLMLVFITILFKQFLILFCPIMALTLGFCVYLPALSTVAIQFFFENRNSGLKSHFLGGVSKCAMFSVYALVFFLLREIMGYSTISLPSYMKLVVFHLPYNEKFASSGIFFATIPGCLSLVAILFALYIFISKKFNIIKNSRGLMEEK